MTPEIDAAIRPFRLAVEDAAIAELKGRLAQVRWPDEASAPPWSYGTSVEFMHELVDYWREANDWRRTEAALNAWLEEGTGAFRCGRQVRFAPTS